MSVTRIFRYSIRLAAWATPYFQRWLRSVNINKKEADLHFQARNYSHAAQFYAAALGDAERRHYSLERRLQFVIKIVECQRRDGKLDQALRLIGATMVKAAMLGLMHPVYGMCLDELAAIQAERGEWGLALEAARKALQVAREDKRAEPAVIGERCYRLAAIELQCGNTSENLSLLREAIDLFERAYGRRHSETANQLSRLGISLLQEGQHDEAMTYLQKASTIHTEILGPDAPESLIDMEHLAEIENARGNLEQAARIYDRLLRFKEKQLGADPVAYSNLLQNASDVYLAVSQRARALECLQEAVNLLDRHPEERAAAIDRLAELYELMGRHSDALQLRCRPLRRATSVR